jgi:hypothetical protein
VVSVGTTTGEKLKSDVGLEIRPDGDMSLGSNVRDKQDVSSATGSGRSNDNSNSRDDNSNSSSSNSNNDNNGNNGSSNSSKESERRRNRGRPPWGSSSTGSRRTHRRR